MAFAVALTRGMSKPGFLCVCTKSVVSYMLSKTLVPNIRLVPIRMSVPTPVDSSFVSP